MSVFVSNILAVEIKEDRELVLAFLQWRQIRGIPSLPYAGGVTGPDFHVDFYDAKHREDIDAFFARHR